MKTMRKPYGMGALLALVMLLLSVPASVFGRPAAIEADRSPKAETSDTRPYVVQGVATRE